ncbi:MAG TPA: DUF1569 domain-containing protein [Edaphobacter sp.]|jgi:hypothetical protein|nr:DUF1569 domain-containing protein [Edaphobacter sp.]
MNAILQTLQFEVASSLHALDATQTQLRPPRSPDRWSIQQIMEHLFLTYSAAESALQGRLDKCTPTKSTATFKNRVQQYAVFSLGYFPTGRPAPSIVMPPETTHPLSGSELTQAATQYLASLDAISREAEKLFGEGRCARHAALGPLSADQWRMFQLIHGRHHLKQIAAIRRAHSL